MTMQRKSAHWVNESITPRWRMNPDKNNLIQRIFDKLNKIPEFKNLSMDRRVELCIFIKKETER
jgi:hypothetical protein